jgi:uncharacterized protein
MEKSNKYALVTGASSGIGWHISAELAGKGYSIVAVSNQPEKLLELKSFLENNSNVNVITLDTDLSVEGAAAWVFDFCTAGNLNIEVLVNNAGIFFFSEISKTEMNMVNAMLMLHNVTPVVLCRLFGGQMAKARKGYILNVSSITAVMPFPAISLYASTKRFIRHFSRAFRAEMKLDNVNVTCLIPGATDTSLYDSGQMNLSLLKKLGMMKSPAVVARAGIKSLFACRAESVPGIFNKMVMLVVPLIPHFIIGLITRHSRLVRK